MVGGALECGNPPGLDGDDRLIVDPELTPIQGDPAEEQVAQLESRLAAMAQQVSGVVDVPPDVREQIAELLSRVQETVATGDEWLARTGPELATQHVRQRLRRAYGVP